jgi:hypothetical protein
LYLTADPDFDITITGSVSGTWTSTGTTADVTALVDEDGWTPVVTLRNYGTTRSIDLGSDSITVDTVGNVVSFTVSYDKAFAAIGMVDPGTWTLYATKTIAGVPNISEIATGNLTIKMWP